ncbi:endolytic transglycosylase MltG [Candidatus Falkowbacteria bacterium]|uniref:Endolytic murein transglycosylase n=1 Tax=Candidatus Buchananbacteria bacterium CG10_big_fil_rev_8_21_14_0_10_33_19 TaxID=1974525 RepID=A0A2H0W458_9BACT|nr:endolytic transglycosylase MltG [Candidatus Falkowbacteria bacterium]PIS06149.1 MAG: endolytic transglycosylase MltG [Candidatus Buchananbacteria bacterium CG10_big_fil_rev_8_21_14_0_10_33_19]
MKKIVILVVFIVFFLTVYFLIDIFTPNSKDKSDIYFDIKIGETLNDVSDDLLSQDLIRHKFIFELYTKLKGQQSKIVAGNHALSKNMSMIDVLRIITTGTSLSNESVITIIEGWRAEEIADYLEKNDIVLKSEFLTAIAIDDWRDQYDFLADVKTKNLEGFLFPDTYRIFSDATVEDIIRKMLDNFDSKLTDQTKADIVSQGKNIFDVVTLASIIEREVPNDADKKMIADVFLKRLKDGIALQSDATVNYVTGYGRSQPTYDDLKIDSLYNTYKYRGLPPGPISNPGVGSIEAVVYPTRNAHYYFLTTKDDGTVIYSQTYEEHLRNKAKYLD